VFAAFVEHCVRVVRLVLVDFFCVASAAGVVCLLFVLVSIIGSYWCFFG
jgi:hypothetical protein